jgi:uncharacterized membrane protein
MLQLRSKPQRNKTSSYRSFRRCHNRFQAVMDQITIIGIAGAVADIVEVIGKTTNTMHDLHNRWEADMTIFNLITQLNALKAALNKIAE